MQLKTLLEIPNPAAITTGDTTAPTPSPNPVSESLGDRTVGSSPGYPILFPLGPSSTPIGTSIPSTDSGLGGLTFAIGTVWAISNTIPSNTALSVFDFNLFRWNVIQAIDILDKKIRDMLDVTEPTCPA